MIEPAVDPRALDLAQLALFVGSAADEWLLARLQERGFVGLRVSHGYLVQHLLRRPHSATELAAELGVSQQAVSKTLAELVQLGYAEPAPSEDGRVRNVQLSRRGRGAVEAVRRLRRELEGTLRKRAGAQAFEQARGVLLVALEQLDGLEPIRNRRVRQPR